MKRLLIKLGIVKLVLSVVSVFYFICFQLMPKDVDGFYVNVFNPLPGGPSEYRSENKRAYEDLQNAEGMVARLTTDIVKTIYNTSTTDVQRTYSNLNDMTYSMDGTIIYKLSNSNRSLINFTTVGYEANKEYAMKDGNSICGIEETVTVRFIENGKKKEESIRLKLGYVPLIKAFKIVDIEIVK